MFQQQKMTNKTDENILNNLLQETFNLEVRNCLLMRVACLISNRYSCKLVCMLTRKWQMIILLLLQYSSMVRLPYTNTVLDKANQIRHTTQQKQLSWWVVLYLTIRKPWTYLFTMDKFPQVCYSLPFCCLCVIYQYSVGNQLENVDQGPDAGVINCLLQMWTARPSFMWFGVSAPLGF